MRAAGLAALSFALACTTPKPETRPAAPAAVGRHVKLFVTAELKGYLGPCGCSENMRGGIARTAFQVAQARQQGAPVFYVDSGDALFGTAQIPPEAVAQQERKARALADAFTLMGLSARAVGPLDDARGRDFRAALGLPEFPPSQVQLLDDGNLAVVNAETVAALTPLAAAARQQGAKFVLALVQQPFDVVTKAATDGLPVDFVLATRGKDEFSTETSRLVRGGTPAAQLQSKGRTLLALELTFAKGATGAFELLRGAADAERELAALDQRIELLRAQVNEPMMNEQLKALRKDKLEEVIARREALAAARPPEPEGKNAFTARFIPIEASFPQAPDALALITAYDRDVGLLNLRYAKEHGKDCPAPEKGKAGYVGSRVCLDCHEDALASWQATKHHASYATLEQVGKNHHLDCIGCHVTGWQQPGGTCRIDRVAERDHVGCESCHGPGSLHADDTEPVSISKGNDAKACTGCHDAENSPHFVFETYVAKVLGPGHGQPMPAGTAKKKVPGTKK